MTDSFVAYFSHGKGAPYFFFQVLHSAFVLATGAWGKYMSFICTHKRLLVCPCVVSPILPITTQVEDAIMTGWQTS